MEGTIPHSASLLSCAVKWKASGQIEEGIDGKRLVLEDLVPDQSSPPQPPDCLCRVKVAEGEAQSEEAYLLNCMVKWFVRGDTETIDDMRKIIFDLKLQPRRCQSSKLHMNSSSRPAETQNSPADPARNGAQLGRKRSVLDGDKEEHASNDARHKQARNQQSDDERRSSEPSLRSLPTTSDTVPPKVTAVSPPTLDLPDESNCEKQNVQPLPCVVQKATCDDGKALRAAIIFQKEFRTFEDAFFSGGWAVGIHDESDGCYFLLGSYSEHSYSQRMYQHAYADTRDNKPFYAGIDSTMSRVKFSECEYWTWEGSWCKVYKQIKMDILTRSGKYKLPLQISSELDHLQHNQCKMSVKTLKSSVCADKKSTPSSDYDKETLKVLESSLLHMSRMVHQQYTKVTKLCVCVYGCIVETTKDIVTGEDLTRELVSVYKESMKGKNKSHAEEKMLLALSKELAEKQEERSHTGTLHLLLVIVNAALKDATPKDVWGGSVCSSCLCAIAQFIVQEGLDTEKLQVVYPTRKKVNGAGWVSPITALLDVSREGKSALEGMIFVRSKMNKHGFDHNVEEIGQDVSSLVKKRVREMKTSPKSRHTDCWKYCCYYNKSTLHQFQTGGHCVGNGDDHSEDGAS
jgi:hypothetical protein